MSNKINEKFVNMVKERAAKNYATNALKTRHDNLLPESYINAVLETLNTEFGIKIDVQWELRSVNKDPE